MENEISKAYAELLEGSYDSVDRIVINGYFRAGQLAGGLRIWWQALYGGDEELDDAHLMRMAGRLRRRLQGYCEQHGIPLLECERQHDASLATREVALMLALHRHQVRREPLRHTSRQHRHPILLSFGHAGP